MSETGQTTKPRTIERQIGYEKDTSSEQRQIHPSVENERNGFAGTQGTEPEVSGVFQESNQETGSVQEYKLISD